MQIHYRRIWRVRWDFFKRVEPKLGHHLMGVQRDLIQIATDLVALQHQTLRYFSQR